MSLMADVLSKSKAKRSKPYVVLDDPFDLPGPSVISFSGGRTSGMMLWSILNRWDGKLPQDATVLFCNTGKERAETLDFVHDCSVKWGVHINWLEKAEEFEHRYRIVDYVSANRNGRVFNAAVNADVNRKDGTRGRKPLPNPVQRSCTAEMKTRTKSRFVKHGLGWKTYHNAVGFRLDEPQRVNRAPNSAETGETIHAPLYDAGVDEAGVMAFWAAQPFDLKLKSHEGNCDLCFMKSLKKINAIMRDKPELAQWWIDVEEEAMASDRPSPFRIDRPRYKDILAAVQNGTAKDYGNFDDEMMCASHGCTD